jgi:hypothetical protein
LEGKKHLHASKVVYFRLRFFQLLDGKIAFNSRLNCLSVAQIGHRFENFGREEEIAFRRGSKMCIAKHSAFGTTVGVATE